MIEEGGVQHQAGRKSHETRPVEAHHGNCRGGGGKGFSYASLYGSLS